MIAIYRMGATLPSPGVSFGNVQKCIGLAQQGDNGVFTLLNLFSGGALLQLSVFALGIMPYITASIILQLLTVVMPRLEQLKKEGQSGQAKITQYTRYLTLGLAILQASAFVALARSGQLFGNNQVCNDNPIIPTSKLPDYVTLAVLVITMTAGTGVIMWLGELITDRGVGNGMSVLMFTSIAARIPSEGHVILQNAGSFVFTLICLLGLAIIVAVVFVGQAQRRIPVQYAKRMVGRRHEEVRRLHPGHSTRTPHRRVPAVRVVARDSARLDLSGHRGSAAELLLQHHQRQQPELPVRRYRGADHGWRCAGHGEADREP